MAQHDDGGVDVADLADRRVDQHRADGGVDLDDVAAGDEAGHVEVVDRHVEEHPAGAREVADRWRQAVAAGDLDEAERRRARRRPTAVAHRLVGRVEAPVETDLQERAGLVDGGERRVDRRRGRARSASRRTSPARPRRRRVISSAWVSVFVQMATASTPRQGVVDSDAATGTS